MTDREKVITGLECCKEKTCIYEKPEKVCPYLQWCGEYEEAFEECTKMLAADALELLKAQEPMKPIRDINGVYYCGICDTICVGYEVEFTHSIIKVENYCHKCGRAVKWE